MNAKEWRTCELNTSSWWPIEARIKTDGHTNVLHGAFVPQIPSEMIERFTEPGEVVADPFTGGGTTALECIRQERCFVGCELNHDTYRATRDRLVEQMGVTAAEPQPLLRLIRGDCLDGKVINKVVRCLDLHDKRIALTMVHPPYLDIIRFNEGDQACLGEMDHSQFMLSMKELAQQYAALSREKAHLVLVIADVWDSRAAELIPLSSQAMEAIRSAGWALRGTVVKNITGTKVQQKNRNLWKYRCLKHGTYTFETEFIYVFRKK